MPVLPRGERRSSKTGRIGYTPHGFVKSAEVIRNERVTEEVNLKSVEAIDTAGVAGGRKCCKSGGFERGRVFHEVGYHMVTGLSRGI
jgi:hypothetical protein